MHLDTCVIRVSGVSAMAALIGLRSTTPAAKTALHREAPASRGVHHISHCGRTVTMPE